MCDYARMRRPTYKEIVVQFADRAVALTGKSRSRIAEGMHSAASTLTRGGKDADFLMSLKVAYTLSEHMGVPIPQIVPDPVRPIASISHLINFAPDSIGLGDTPDIDIDWETALGDRRHANDSKR